MCNCPGRFPDSALRKTTPSRLRSAMAQTDVRSHQQPSVRQWHCFEECFRMLRCCNKQAEQSGFTVAGTVPVSHRIPFYTTRWNNGVYHLSGDKYSGLFLIDKGKGGIMQPVLRSDLLCITDLLCFAGWIFSSLGTIFPVSWDEYFQLIRRITKRGLSVILPDSL